MIMTMGTAWYTDVHLKEGVKMSVSYVKMCFKMHKRKHIDIIEKA